MTSPSGDRALKSSGKERDWPPTAMAEATQASSDLLLVWIGASRRRSGVASSLRSSLGCRLLSLSSEVASNSVPTASCAEH